MREVERGGKKGKEEGRRGRSRRKEGWEVETFAFQSS